MTQLAFPAGSAPAVARSDGNPADLEIGGTAAPRRTVPGLADGPAAGQRTEPPTPQLSIVIPVLNEAPNLTPLLAEISVALAGLVPYEVIVVDDGSTDRTPEILAARRAADPRLRVVRHRRRQGQSAAILSGVTAARAPWVATLDGDGQNDPADIPRLWRLAQEDDAAAPRLIAGHRTQRRDSWSTRLGSRLANAVRGRLLDDRSPDTGCGLKLFERRAFLALPRFDHMHRFLPALFQMAGRSVVTVPVNHRPRTAGRSHYGLLGRLGVGLPDLLGVIWLRARRLDDRAGTEVTEDDR